MRRLVIALTVVCGLVPASAAAGPWEVIEREGQNRAAVSNGNGTISLNIFCGGDGAMVGIERAADVPWLGSQPAELVIEGEAFPIVPLAEGDTWAVFNIDPIGLKPAMVGALRAGAKFEIRGPATSDIETGALAFTLEGSSRALDEVPGGCT